MTEVSESLGPNSAFFDEVFEESQSLFFRPLITIDSKLQDVDPSPDTDELPVTAETDQITTDSKDTYKPWSGKKWAAVLSAAALGIAAFSYVAVRYGGPQSQQSSAPTELSVDLNSLPNTLPAAVKARVDDVGIVEDEVYASQDIAGDSDNYESYRWVNGVQINPNLALSGGGLISYSSGQLSSATECQQVTFEDGYLSKVEAARDFIADGYGTTSPSIPSKTPELEALALPQQQDQYPFTNKPPKNITIAPKPPTPGEVLYVVDYEDQNGGLYYNMNNGTGPAIYAGIYTGTYSNGTYEILTGIKSYGHERDSYSWAGSEDAAILNGRGQEVALEESWSAKSASIRQYEKWDGVRLTGDAPTKLIDDIYGQPATRVLARKYQKAEQPITQDCFTEAMAG